MAEPPKYNLFNNSDGIKETKSYTIRYGGGDALEQFYYRIIYALRENRRYEYIAKVKDTYNVSANTQQFGFATQNLRQEISSASSLVGQINQIGKSILSMKKDRQRIEECLGYYGKYKDKPEELEAVLKGLWLDFVDSKTGPASLTQAAQKLEFMVARDMFFKFKNNEALKKFNTDEKLNIPNNVMTFLERKFGEYEQWKPKWKERLDEMSKMIDMQLKTSVESINMYKQWAKPLIRNIQALELSPDWTNPEILKIGGSTFSEVHIVAWDKVEPEMGKRKKFTYEKATKKEDLDKPFGEKGKCKYGKDEVPFMPLIYIKLGLRTGTGGYTETVAKFQSLVIDKKKFEELYYGAWFKDPIQDWIDKLLLNESFGGTEEGKKKEESKKEESLLDMIAKKFELKPPKFVQNRALKKKKVPAFKIQSLADKAGTEVLKDLALVYFVVKKGFGMLSELQMYRS